MKILAFDTTSSQGSAAVLEDDQLLGEVAFSGISSHSVHLLKTIDFLLNQLSLSIKDIEAYAVAAGPGSFTGIRVGLSTAKGLARASLRPIAPVSGLRALAYKVNFQDGLPIAVMIDARKGEVFAALFKIREEEWRELVPEGAYKPNNFLSLLPPEQKILLVGSGVELYKNRVLAFLGERAVLSKRTLFIAYEVGLLGWHLLKHGRGLAPQEVEAIYYRPSQAEEKLPLVMTEKKDS